MAKNCITIDCLSANFPGINQGDKHFKFLSSNLYLICMWGAAEKCKVFLSIFLMVFLIVFHSVFFLLNSIVFKSLSWSKRWDASLMGHNLGYKFCRRKPRRLQQCGCLETMSSKILFIQGPSLFDTNIIVAFQTSSHYFSTEKYGNMKINWEQIRSNQLHIGYSVTETFFKRF